MTKKILVFALTLFATATKTTAQVSIDAKNFPDENFRNWVLAQKYGKDGKLTDEEIATVKEIEIGDKPITNLKGIEYFTALTMLFCWNNQLTELDLSENTELTILNCIGNKLVKLDVSKNKKLSIIECSNNLLAEIDISQNTALIELGCHDNLLTKLDVLNNTTLNTLFCYNNKLTKLDISKCKNLQGLWCHDNQLDTLDVSKNMELERLQCSNNQLNMLDVSENTKLESLNCNGNLLTTIEISKNNTELNDLWCYDNKIKDEKMQTLVENLPTVEDGELCVINLANNDENAITKGQVKIAESKGWKVVDSDREEYAGSDPMGIENKNSEPIINNRYYSIDGVKQQGKPTKKGVYVTNGKKAIVR